MPKSDWRRFTPRSVSGAEFESMEKMLTNKGISREDLIFIFRCLEINPTCKGVFEKRGEDGMAVFLEVLSNCMTEEQVEVLRQALKKGMPVYFYGGEGSGKSLLAETFINAGFKADEPGLHENPYNGAMSVYDMEGTVAFCLKKNTTNSSPREFNIFDFLLGCSAQIIEWVNQ